MTVIHLPALLVVEHFSIPYNQSCIHACAISAQVVNAIQMMLNGLNVVSEGAGAVTLAAALSGQAGAGKICCVITGGNIDPDFLTKVNISFVNYYYSLK